MGIVAFALRYRHTFYVLALMMLFLGGSAIVDHAERYFPQHQYSGRYGDLAIHRSDARGNGTARHHL